jgi:prevent-host-death family protein
MVMGKEKRVGLAELKARLSHYLRAVREGERITVLDRDRPVARLVPFESGDALVIRRPAPDAGRPGDLRFPPPSQPIETDVVALLLEDRGRR